MRSGWHSHCRCFGQGNRLSKSPDTTPLVSRAGGKLQHALDVFDLDVTGLRCADLGCNVGGFTDCLLRGGAASVISLDTGYGILAWKLRQDPRVEVRERSNAMHAEPPEDGVDLVTLDLGWTPQRHALPAAKQWIKDGGRILSLVKPHYELNEAQRREHLVDGRLSDEVAEAMLLAVLESLDGLGLHAINTTISPIRGGKSSRGKGKGNREYLLLAEVQ